MVISSLPKLTECPSEYQGTKEQGHLDRKQDRLEAAGELQPLTECAREVTPPLNAVHPPFFLLVSR